MAGVQISFVKSNFPEEIFSIKSSEPTISAPLFLNSFILSDSQITAIFSFFPEPLGNLRIFLKLKSPPFDCFKFNLKDISMDSSNFVF